MATPQAQRGPQTYHVTHGSHPTRIAALARKKAPPQTAQALEQRRAEILRLAATGMKRTDIASAVDLTVGRIGQIMGEARSQGELPRWIVPAPATSILTPRAETEMHIRSAIRATMDDDYLDRLRALAAFPALPLTTVFWPALEGAPAARLDRLVTVATRCAADLSEALIIGELTAVGVKFAREFPEAPRGVDSTS